MKTSWPVLALVAAALSFAGLGIASSQETYKVNGQLIGSQETPKNTSKAQAASLARSSRRASRRR